jgi:hypothetical protein
LLQTHNNAAQSHSPSHGKGRCSVAQTTGISVAAEFENFKQSDPGK